MRILIADDHELFLKGLEIILKDFNPEAELVKAKNYAEMLNIINKNQSFSLLFAGNNHHQKSLVHMTQNLHYQNNTPSHTLYPIMVMTEDRNHHSNPNNMQYHRRSITFPYQEKHSHNQKISIHRIVSDTETSMMYQIQNLVGYLDFPTICSYKTALLLSSIA